MNKADLKFAVKDKLGISAVEASSAVDAMLGAISDSLKSGEDVVIPGFGAFAVKQQAARTVHNPKTGETVEVPAKMAIKFKPGKTLKDAVNA